MIRKNLLDYVDSQGCIIQKSKNKFNAIDSNFLTTNYLYQEYLAEGGSKSGLNLVYNFIGYGKLIRYWRDSVHYDSEGSFWTNPKTVSRDNSMGALCCLVELNDTKFMRNFAWDLLKRFSFFQNTHTVKGVKKTLPDYCIAEWAIVLRGITKSKLMYPLLMFFDLLMFINVLFYVVKNWHDNDYNSPLFHLVSQVECINRHNPTPFGMLSRWTLYHLVPVNEKYDHSEPIITQLMEYSRMDYDPPIYKATEKILKRYRDEN
jgi:hypothetical protein